MAELRIPVDPDAHAAVKLFAAQKRTTVARLVRSLLAEHIPEFEMPKKAKALADARELERLEQTGKAA